MYLTCILKQVKLNMQNPTPISYRWELHKQVGPSCLVCGLQLPSGWPNLPEHQRELDFGVMHLLGALPLAKLSWYGGCLNDLNAWIPNSVARSHLSVHLFNRAIQCGVAIFLVHVVISSSALVSQPNSIVVYLGGILLKNLQLTRITQENKK